MKPPLNIKINHTQTTEWNEDELRFTEEEKARLLGESPIEETDLATARESLVGLPLWRLAIMAVENGEGVESVLGDAIDFATKDKVDGYVAVIERMAVEKKIADATVDAIMSEMVARQQKRSADFAKALETVKDRALAAMRLMPCRECGGNGCKECKETGHKTILEGKTSTLQANKVASSASVGETFVPLQYKTVTFSIKCNAADMTPILTHLRDRCSAWGIDTPKVDYSTNRADILRDLKKGMEINGATLVTDRLSLVVK